MTRLRAGLPPLPPRMVNLPIDERGYPVPYFVAWVDGKPDFRVMDPAKFKRAVESRRCWVCGEPLGRLKTFVIGPMCAVNRISAEPPAHRSCAVFSATACPFLRLPMAQRREANLPAETQAPAGEMITRNPGVTLLWTCRHYQIVRAHNGVLIKIGDPIEVAWYSHGRAATRAEVLESIESGLPILKGMAEHQGPNAMMRLGYMTGQAMKLLPAA